MRSAMGAASLLPGMGPTDVNVAPVPACLLKNLVMMMMMMMYTFKILLGEKI